LGTMVAMTSTHTKTTTTKVGGGACRRTVDRGR